MIIYIGVERFIDWVGVSRSKVNEDIKKGILQSKKYGKKLMINYAKFVEDLDNNKLNDAEKFTNLSE